MLMGARKLLAQAAQVGAELHDERLGVVDAVAAALVQGSRFFFAVGLLQDVLRVGAARDVDVAGPLERNAPDGRRRVGVLFGRDLTREKKALLPTVGKLLI